MKKVSMILLLILLAVSFLACSSKGIKTNGEYGNLYRTTTNTESDGSYQTIIISKIYKSDNSVLIDTSSPIEDMKYALNNFLYFQLYDQNQNNIKIGKIQLLELNKSAIFKIKCNNENDFDKITYIEIGPYQTKDEKHLIYKIG